MKIRPIEKHDVTKVAEIDKRWNTVRVSDPDLGSMEVTNSWALQAPEIVDIVRQRRDTNYQAYDTRTYVLEENVKIKGGASVREVMGAFAYEKHPLSMEVLYVTLHPKADVVKVINDIAVFLKSMADASDKRKTVNVYLRDRDEARLRDVLPVWMSVGFKVKLVPDYFVEHDGWRCSYVSTKQAAPSNEDEVSV